MKSQLVLFSLVSIVLSASIFQSFLKGFEQLNSISQEVLQQDEETELIKLHRNLVEISSISQNETSVSEFLANYLKKQGLTVETQSIDDSGKRQNIYAYFGDSKDAKVLISSHIDTVPPFIPYRREGDLIYGRGSVDAKGSVATQILSTLNLFQNGEIQNGDVALLFVVSEELDGAGMKFVNEHLDANWDHAIFGEPTEGKLGVGHKGIYNFAIEVQGKASHSGYPELGIDANTKLINILHKIIHSEYPTNELLGNSTINPGIIDAGVASNVVSPIAKARVLIRVASDASKVVEIISNIIEEENQEYHNINLIQSQYSEPAYLNFTVPGFESIVLAYATDIPYLTRDFKSRYLYGPGTIHVAHSANEYLSIKDLENAVIGYENLTKYLLHKQD
ncbi:putative secreted protein [Wickerhamomyces ciferrii]|uniref:Secreted protein n=1 Tax=Wickerhamomyces ciferrii (strain ATCC 14091 / BCRC 22168 / CBS 111 / JCM 3599 / NBRC 0793 / NRRL Y-1031 F-60-10) TaxID=1206466 RepID=K0KKS5_WICCF|nr:uncharacterized protein BN7_3164 [Wickerhamomyces ciferrii]CCH43611.1 putative secreted protein [Wickerhamomyces ciferrii]